MQSVLTQMDFARPVNLATILAMAPAQCALNSLGLWEIPQFASFVTLDVSTVNPQMAVVMPVFRDLSYKLIEVVVIALEQLTRTVDRIAVSPVISAVVVLVTHRTVVVKHAFPDLR